jgi:DNA-binding CsgD family transcriptional regulator
MGAESPVPAGAPSGLLERELELGAIDVFFDRLRAGRGGRLLIEGPAGIGKSAMLELAADRAGQLGMVCLWAEASEVASQVAFGVARAALGPLWPEPEDGARGSADLGVLQRGVQVLLDVAEGRGVLLCVDDVQWADGASQRWLALLAQRASGGPIGIALAARTGEREHEPPLLGELLDSRRAIVVRPAALSEPAAAKVLAERLGPALDDALAGWCHEETGGNPYLLRALADALRQAGVPSGEGARAQLRELGARAISRSVTGRLERLDAEARRLVEACSVVGDVGDLALLAAIADVPSARAQDAVGRLVELDLLRSAEVLEPAHPLVGSSIRRQVSAQQREWLARRAADRLRGAGLVQEAAARLVDLPPARDPIVARTLADAAQLAAGRGAGDVAATLLRRALAEPPPPDLELELRVALGRALLSVGDPDAVDVLRTVLADIPPGAQAVALAASLAMALNYARQTDDAVAVLDAARTGLGPEDADLDEELEAMTLHYLTFDPATMVERRRRMARLGASRGVSELAHRMRLAELATDSLITAQPASETVALAERALAGGMLISRDNSAFSKAVLALAYAGRPGAARTHLNDAVATFRAQGDTVKIGFTLALHGEVGRLEGNMVAVESDTRTGLELLPRGELGPRWILRGLIESLVEQDRTAEAEEELRAGELTGELPEVLPTPGLLYAHAKARIAAGAVALGLDTLLRAGEIAERLTLRDPISVPWRLAAAEAMLALGDRERAAELVGEHLTIAERTAIPEAVGAALRVKGLLEGRPALAQAVSLLDGGFAQLELARALVDLGAAVSEDDPREARELLRRGGELAEQLGAVTLATRARDLIVQAGGKPRRATRVGAQALTPAERRTARLAAEGMTNREIAETLVLSEKTIETHLAATFRKLGIRSRGQLAPVIAGAAPDSPPATR